MVITIPVTVLIVELELFVLRIVVGVKVDTCRDLRTLDTALMTLDN